MKLWSSRLLTKAILRESGAHTGLPWLPKTLKSGCCGPATATPPLVTPPGFTTPGFTGAR